MTNAIPKRAITLEIVQIGDEAGIILPDEMLARLGMKANDTMFLSETEDGYLLSVREDVPSPMTVAREVMSRRRSALRELAK